MCLSHTTGFPNWRQLPIDTIGFDPNGKLAIYFTPGTRYAYSGEGITLLQLVVEKVAGQTVADLAEERIFQPLGLTRTSYTWNPVFADDCAVGHDSEGYTLYKDDGTMGKPVFPKPFAAGSPGKQHFGLCPANRFCQCVLRSRGFFARARDRDSFHLSVPHHHQRHHGPKNDPIQLSYGLGWGLFTGRYGKAFSKEGHANGWQNYNVNFPTRGTAIILMSNSDNAGKHFPGAARRKTHRGHRYPWKWERYVPHTILNSIHHEKKIILAGPAADHGHDGPRAAGRRSARTPLSRATRTPLTDKAPAAHPRPWRAPAGKGDLHLESPTPAIMDFTATPSPSSTHCRPRP